MVTLAIYFVLYKNKIMSVELMFSTNKLGLLTGDVTEGIEFREEILVFKNDRLSLR